MASLYAEFLRKPHDAHALVRIFLQHFQAPKRGRHKIRVRILSFIYILL